MRCPRLRKRPKGSTSREKKKKKKSKENETLPSLTQYDELRVKMPVTTEEPISEINHQSVGFYFGVRG